MVSTLKNRIFILSVDYNRKSKPSRISVVYFRCKITPTAPTANILTILKCPLVHLQSGALRSCGQSHPALTHPMMKESENIGAVSIWSGHLVLTFHSTKGNTEDVKGHASSPHHSSVKVQYYSQIKLYKATKALISPPQGLVPSSLGVPSRCKVYDSTASPQHSIGWISASFYIPSRWSVDLENMNNQSGFAWILRRSEFQTHLSPPSSVCVSWHSVGRITATETLDAILVACSNANIEIIDLACRTTGNMLEFSFFLVQVPYSEFYRLSFVVGYMG